MFHCTMRVIKVGHQYNNCYVVFTQTPAWLSEMIEHPTWRSLIYRLAEEYPDCLMLNFTIKVWPCCFAFCWLVATEIMALKVLQGDVVCILCTKCINYAHNGMYLDTDPHASTMKIRNKLSWGMVQGVGIENC